MWYILKSHIITGINLFIPKARLRTRQFPVWFTSHLRHSLKCLRTLQRKCNKHPTPSNLEHLIKAQESFHASHAAAKSEYEQNLVHNFVINKDPKIFQYIRDFTKTWVFPPQLCDGSTTADTDDSKAELFNKYFYSVFTRSDFHVPNPDDLPLPENSLNSISLTVQEVLNALTNLNPNKASGIDNIPPILLKSCAHALVIPIHYLFTTSILTVD